MKTLGALLASLVLFCCIGLTWGCAIGDDNTGSAKQSQHEGASQQQDKYPSGEYYTQITAEKYVAKSNNRWVSQDEEKTAVISLEFNGDSVKINLKSREKNGDISSDCDSLELEMTPDKNDGENVKIALVDKEMGEWGRVRGFVGASESGKIDLFLVSYTTGYVGGIKETYRHKFDISGGHGAPMTSYSQEFYSKDKLLEETPAMRKKGHDPFRESARGEGIIVDFGEIMEAFGSGSNCGGSPSGDSTPTP